MTGAVPKKFMFDQVLDPGGQRERDPKAPETLTLTIDDLEALKTKVHTAGFDRGYEQGKVDTHDQLQGQIYGAVQRIETEVQLFFAAQLHQDQVIGDGFQRLFRLMASQFFPVFARTHGVEEIVQVIHQTLEKVRDLSLIIHLPSQVCAAVADRFTDYPHLVFKGDDTLGDSDVRIEWPMGSAERRLARIIGELEALAPLSLEKQIVDTHQTASKTGEHP